MISVIIPAFNSAESITRSIESVLGQSYKDFEIIVVDDGSSDETSELVKKFGSKVNYIYQENSGASVARNTGIAAAKGGWIAFLDADDQWLPEKLDSQMKLFERNPDIKWCSSNWLQTNGPKQAPAGDKTKITAGLNGKNYFENYFTAALKGCCPILTSTIIVERTVFYEVGDFDPAFLRAQDQDMWWRIAHYHPRIGYIPQMLAVRHLDCENPILLKRRLATRSESNRRKFMPKQLKIAKERGTIEQFRPFASRMMKQTILTMMIHGNKQQARQILNEFSELFSRPWRVAVMVMTTFPRLTAAAAHTALYLEHFLGLERNVTRRWTDTKKAMEIKSEQKKG